MIDEDALVAAAVGGDLVAFSRLWQLLSPIVAGYLRARGVRDVDDVTSEVFLATYARLRDFSGDGSAFRRYVFTLAHHKSVNDIRSRYGPRVPLQVPISEETDTRRSPSAETEALSDELDEQLEDMLRLLPEVQREVLLLRVVAGLTVGQVADILGRTSGAVSQLQHRALTSLRSVVSQQSAAADIGSLRTWTV